MRQPKNEEKCGNERGVLIPYQLRGGVFFLYDHFRLVCMGKRADGECYKIEDDLGRNYW